MLVKCIWCKLLFAFDLSFGKSPLKAASVIIFITLLRTTLITTVETTLKFHATSFSSCLSHE